MSASTGGGADAFQYVPPDRLKLYRNGAVIGAGKQRKLNFSTNFTVSENAGTNSYDIDVGAATDANAAHTNTDNNFGAHYQDLSQIATPAAPASGVRRLHVNSATGQLSIEKSDGSVVSLESIVTAREDLCAQWGDCGADNVSTSYVDATWAHTTFSGSSVAGAKATTSIDFTGKTQYKVAIGIVINGTMTTAKAKIVDDSTTTNTLQEFTNLSNSSGTQTSTLASLPGWATGVKTLRMQVAGAGTTDDIGIPSCSVYLK